MRMYMHFASTSLIKTDLELRKFIILICFSITEMLIFVMFKMTSLKISIELAIEEVNCKFPDSRCKVTDLFQPTIMLFVLPAYEGASQLTISKSVCFFFFTLSPYSLLYLFCFWLFLYLLSKPELKHAQTWPFLFYI